MNLVLRIFNEGAYLTFKPIFHKVLNLFQFDCESILESVPGTNQYQAMRVSCSQKQREPLIGFQHTTDRLQVRHDTHFYHAAPHVYENTRLLRTHFSWTRSLIWYTNIQYIKQIMLITNLLSPQAPIEFTTPIVLLYFRLLPQLSCTSSVKIPACRQIFRTTQAPYEQRLRILNNYQSSTEMCPTILSSRQIQTWQPYEIYVNSVTCCQVQNVRVFVLLRFYQFYVFLQNY